MVDCAIIVFFVDLTVVFQLASLKLRVYQVEIFQKSSLYRQGILLAKESKIKLFGNFGLLVAIRKLRQTGKTLPKRVELAVLAGMTDRCAWLAITLFSAFRVVVIAKTCLDVQIVTLITGCAVRNDSFVWLTAVRALPRDIAHAKAPPRTLFLIFLTFPILISGVAQLTRQTVVCWLSIRFKTLRTSRYWQCFVALSTCF